MGAGGRQLLRRPADCGAGAAARTGATNNTTRLAPHLHWQVPQLQAPHQAN